MSRKEPFSFVKHTFIEIGFLLFGLIFVILLLFVYIASIPVFLFRLIIRKLAYIVRPDLTAFVQAQGNIFAAELFSSKAPRCSLVVPLVIKGHVPEQEFYRRISQMINKTDPETGKEVYPEYKQFVELWFGFAFWKNDSHFDIHNHIKFYNLDGRLVSTKEATLLTETLLNKQFQIGKSPWELNVVYNYDDPELPAGPKTVMIFRIHHSLADGYSILCSLVEGILQEPLQSQCKLPTPTFSKRGKWAEILFRVTLPVRIMRDAGDYFVKAARENPFNVPDGKKAWKQHYGRAELVPIQKIKDIKNKLGVTFTSVLLAAVSAGLSAVTKEKLLKLNRTNRIERAAFFIPLPVQGGHPNALTNHVTGAQIDLPMAEFSDPILRVKDCDRQIAQQKESTIPLLLLFLGRTLGHHFTALCGVITANRVNVAGLTNFPVSIFNGIKDSLQFELLDTELAAGALLGVSGVAYMALSYGKNIRFSVTVESSVLTREDVDTLLRLLLEEINVLHQLVVQKND